MLLAPLGHAMPRILIVDDHAGYRWALKTGLEKAGYEVLELDRGGETLEVACRRKPDAILLDLDLPDVRGTVLCAQLKAKAQTASIPVVIATGSGSEQDRIEGFEAGADDFVVKPFSLRELHLRLRVLVKREPRKPSDQIRMGVLTVHPAAYRVFVGGHEADLTRVEFLLLRTLCESHARVLSRDELLDLVWGADAELNARIVDGYVRRLRQKLGPAGEYIQTVRGAGYRLEERNGNSNQAN